MQKGNKALKPTSVSADNSNVRLWSQAYGLAPAAIMRRHMISYSSFWPVKLEVHTINRQRFPIICVIWLLFAVFTARAAGAESAAVDNITVQITTAQSTQVPPARIAKRMAASVATIGENVLVGRKVNEIVDKKDSYEKLVKEVFDRILVGYSVQKVIISPGSTTNIAVEIVPWGEVVNDVVLEIDFGGMSPELAALVKQDMGDIEDRVSNVLIGLPVDAVDWAGGVSKSVIRELLTAQLPEFRSNFEIIPGSRTVVKLSLIPQGAVVQDVRVSLRSHTIPNLLLLRARPNVEQAAKSLNGLPVAFIERHRDYFTAKLAAAAAEYPLVRRYALTVTPVINAGSNTEIVLDVDTDKYNVSLEGYLVVVVGAIVLVRIL